MNNELFRKKSIDRITSPESLNDYIRISNPGILLLLLAVIALIIGAFVWGTFGYVETKVNASAVFDDGVAVCSVESSDIKVGMDVKVGNDSGTVSDVKYKDDNCTLTVKADIPDGKYDFYVVTEKVHPIFFVLN